MMKTVYLVGFMGAGKTTFGKNLAKKLAIPFYDLDQLIVEGVGCSLNDYFLLHGESKFREVEREFLLRTKDLPTCVLSTGGGTPCFFNNMEWMNANGITVFLSVSEGVLMNRLLKNPHKRPLLKGKSEEELRNFITQILPRRTKFYNQAHISFDPVSKKVDVLALELMAVGTQNN